jgi:hypothetical protein
MPKKECIEFDEKNKGNIKTTREKRGRRKIMKK